MVKCIWFAPLIMAIHYKRTDGYRVTQSRKMRIDVKLIVFKFPRALKAMSLRLNNINSLGLLFLMNLKPEGLNISNRW